VTLCDGVWVCVGMSGCVRVYDEGVRWCVKVCEGVWGCCDDVRVFERV